MRHSIVGCGLREPKSFLSVTAHPILNEARLWEKLFVDAKEVRLISSSTSIRGNSPNPHQTLRLSRVQFGSLISSKRAIGDVLGLNIRRGTATSNCASIAELPPSLLVGRLGIEEKMASTSTRVQYALDCRNVS